MNSINWIIKKFGIPKIHYNYLSLMAFSSLILIIFFIPYSCDKNSINPPPIKPILVLHYPFSGNCNDESGNENDCTVHGATLTSDCQGQATSAYDFNGTSSYIDVSDDATLRLSELSVTVWVFIHEFSDQSGYETFLRKQYGNNDASYELGVNTETHKASFGINLGSSNPTDGSATSSPS